MDISKVLDEAKKKLDITSDYELGKRLGISKQRISAYRAGTQIPNAYACAKLADALGIDPLGLLAQVEAATEKNEARRNYWRAVSERVGAGVIACFFVIITLIPNDLRASASGEKVQNNQGLTVFRT